jgi:hypothetical protein
LTSGALILAVKINFSLDPKNSFFKFQTQIIAEICPSSGSPSSTATSHSESEEFFKDVGEIKTEIRWHSLKTGVSISIIRGPALSIRENSIGFIDLFETVFGTRILVDVGVVLLRQPAVGASNVIV